MRKKYRKNNKKQLISKKSLFLVLIIFLIIIFGFLIFNHFNSKKKNNNIIQEYLTADLTTQDLSQITSNNDIGITRNTQQGLLGSKNDGSPKPGLAKTWNHSKNGLIWTFHLRKHLKWSNGDPLTASDFVYAWRRTVKPKTASQYAYIYSGIKNADEINSGKNKSLKSLGISAPNKNTVVVTLSHPMPQFAKLMDFPSFFAQDKKFVQNHGKKTGTNSSNQVYDGPYKFVGWNGDNKKFKVIPNKNYWNKKAVKNKGINYQVVSDPTAALALFKKGQLDEVGLTTPEQVRKYKNNKKFRQVNDASTDFLIYNLKNPALKNKKIRQALNLATNRKPIVKTISNGINIPATGLTPKGIIKTNKDQDFTKAVRQVTSYRYNLGKAKKLFSQGLNQLHLKHLTLSLEGSNELPTHKDILDSLQQNWEKIPDLTVKENLVPYKQRMQDFHNHNFQIQLTWWGADYQEPQTFLNLFVTNGENNVGSWSDKDYDQTIKKATTTDALDNRKRTNDEIVSEKILYKKSPIDPLDWLQQAYLINPQLKHLNFNSGGSLHEQWKAYK